MTCQLVQLFCYAHTYTLGFWTPITSPPPIYTHTTSICCLAEVLLCQSSIDTLLYIAFSLSLLLKYLKTMDYNLAMAPSPRRSGVLRISGFGTGSTGNLRVDSTGGSIGSTHDPGSSIGPGICSIDLNIRGLSTNLPSVEHHLAISPP